MLPTLLHIQLTCPRSHMKLSPLNQSSPGHLTITQQPQSLIQKDIKLILKYIQKLEDLPVTEDPLVIEGIITMPNLMIVMEMSLMFLKKDS